MIKLIALYKTPADADAFLEHYKTVHLPLVNKIPGLLRTEVSRIAGTIMGDQGNFLLAEMYFADDATYKAAMKSPENAAAGKDLGTFAAKFATLMKGEVLDLQ